MSLFGSILKGVSGAGLGFLTGGPAGAISGGIGGLTSGIATDKANKGISAAANAQITSGQKIIDAQKLAGQTSIPALQAAGQRAIDAQKAAGQTLVGAQQGAANQQSNFAIANRDFQYNASAPTIAAGDMATGNYSDFINGNANGLEAFRENSGYQDLLRTGLDAVNANASFRGARNSGAALKALQDRATGIADRSASEYLGNLTPLISAGANARGLNAQVGSQTVGAVNTATGNAANAVERAALLDAGQIDQSALLEAQAASQAAQLNASAAATAAGLEADATGNSALLTARNNSNGIEQLGSLGLDALTKLTGSSFGKKATTPATTNSSNLTQLASLFKNPFSVSGTNYNTTRLF